MAAYKVRFKRTASATLSVGSCVADATRPRRLKLSSYSIGCEGTPADNVFLWRIQRCTAAGTSTAVTPKPVDFADAVTEFDAGENHTVEPTYTANEYMDEVPLNQRATYRWVAEPGCEITCPATASNGFGIWTPVMTALLVTAVVTVLEQ